MTRQAAQRLSRLEESIERSVDSHITGGLRNDKRRRYRRDSRAPWPSRRTLGEYRHHLQRDSVKPGKRCKVRTWTASSRWKAIGFNEIGTSHWSGQKRTHSAGRDLRKTLAGRPKSRLRDALILAIAGPTCSNMSRRNALGILQLVSDGRIYKAIPEEAWKQLIGPPLRTS